MVSGVSQESRGLSRDMKDDRGVGTLGNTLSGKEKNKGKHPREEDGEFIGEQRGQWPWWEGGGGGPRMGRWGVRTRGAVRAPREGS